MDSAHLSRRELLTASAIGLAALGTSKIALAQGAANTAAGTAGATSAGLAQGATPNLATPEKPLPALGWGIIGTGSRARIHIAALKQTPGQTIVAACDVDEARLQQGAGRIGNPVNTYRDYHQLLADPAVGAVIICTPNLLHREMVEAALKAGKHILCEKPLASSPEDAAAVLRLAQNSNTVVQFGLQLRYAFRYQELIKLVASGKIGAPRYLFLAEFRGDWNDKNVWLYPHPKTGQPINWRYSHKASGGTLNEKCCHYFDILDWLAGAAPASISASGGNSFYRDRETWDHASVVLNYANGVQANLGLCMFGPHRLDLQVIGEEGSLHLPSGENQALLQKRGSKTVETVTFTPEVGHGVRGPERGTETAVLRMYRDMLESIRDGRNPLVDAQVAYDSSKIAFLAEIARNEKKEVPWTAL